MKKLVLWFLFAVVLLSVALVTSRNIIFKRYIETSAEKALGLSVTIKDFHVSLTGNHIKARHISVMSPKGFQDSVLASIPLIEIVWDPFEYLKNKKVHFYFMDLQVELISVIKNSEGLVNIKAIRAIKRGEEEKKTKKLPFTVDVLRLSVKDVSYTDYYRKRKPTSRVYPINISDIAFGNVDSSQDVVNLVIYRAFSSTNIGKLINLSLVPISKNVADTVMLPARLVHSTIKSIGGITGLFTPTP